MNIERLSVEEWRRHLPSSGFEVFHTPDALAVMDRHLSGELQLYGGFKGDQAVGLVPVFEQRRSVGRALLSPPPSSGIPHLGPLVMPVSPKPRKREQVTERFVSGVLDRLEAESPQTLVRLVCPTGHTDPRPFRWEGLSVDVRFTYHLPVDTDDPDAVMRSFSKSLRREIRDLADSDVTVEVSDDEVTAAKRVYDDIAARYAEQSASFPLTWAYVRDLVTTLEGRSRVYVARDGDGEYLTGLIVLYSNDAAYYWEGGARATYDGASVNSYLHWAVVEDAVTDPALDDVTHYDMVGANTRRLCQYKSKYAPELVPYYVVESDSTTMDLAKTAYSWLRQ